MSGSLPAKFQHLEQWSAWANATEGERHKKRVETSMGDLKVFHSALKPHIEDMIVYLSDFPWGTRLDQKDEQLYFLGLAYMEAAVPIDLGWPNSAAQDSFPVSRVKMPARL
jgi:hypothetical protein